MVMLLRGEDGNEFELGLIEDRLAEIQDGYGDASMLTLSFRVATPDESWEETAPCLNTYEVRNLAEWLDAVGQGSAQPGELAELDLLEPELNFAVIKDTGEEVTVRVGFHLDDRPEVYEVDSPTNEASHVDLRLPRDHLRIAAAQLREEIEDLEHPGSTGLTETIPSQTPGLLKDDLFGDADLGQVRPAEDDLGLGPRPVSEEDVGFGMGLDEGEESLFERLEDGEDVEE
jgi:hypothetical protein